MGYFDKKRFTMGQVVGLLAIVLLGAAVIAYASTVTIPNTFTSGTTISSSEMNGNFSAVKSAVDDNDSRITALETMMQSPLKSVEINEQLNVSSSLQYFTNDHLIATPPGDGFLLISANVRYNCRSDAETQSRFGVFISTSSAVPSASDELTYWENVGFAFTLEGSFSPAAFGDFNPRIMHVEPVTGGTTYHIWFGVDGANITSPFCGVINPKIIATYHPAGL